MPKLEGVEVSFFIKHFIKTQIIKSGQIKTIYLFSTSLIIYLRLDNVYLIRN